MSPLTIFVTLATLSLATAQEISILPYPISPTCTSTLTHPPGCCPKLPAHTTTSYTACGPCALDIVTEGPMCMMWCGTSTPIDPFKTTTVTACSPTAPPSLVTCVSCTAACTKTVTEGNPFPCGDCGVGSVDVTTSVDCGGCGLKTVTEEGGFGICVCPTEKATRVVSVCATSVEAVVTGV